MDQQTTSVIRVAREFAERHKNANNEDHLGILLGVAFLNLQVGIDRTGFINMASAAWDAMERLDQVVKGKAVAPTEGSDRRMARDADMFVQRYEHCDVDDLKGILLGFAILCIRKIGDSKEMFSKVALSTWDLAVATEKARNGRQNEG